MRAWDESEAAVRRAAERRAEVQAEALDDLAASGIDLDPLGTAHDGDDPGTAARTSTTSAHPHAHPHVHVAPGARPVTGIVGAGAVGVALGVALARAGWPVHAVASRDPARRARFRELVPGVRAFAEASALVDDVELVILAVPDDVVGRLAGSLRLYAGQALVHTSGLLGADALAPAMAAGTQAGAFHPLVAFADLDRALAALQGRDDRDRGRRRAGRAPRRHGRGDRWRAGAPRARLEGRVPRRGRAGGRRRRRAAGHDPRGRGR